MLGDLLTSLANDATALEAIAGAGDLKLLTAAQQAAVAESLDVGSYVAQAVQRYAHEASDEEWVTLLGLLNRAPDPGAICIRRALEHALRG